MTNIFQIMLMILFIALTLVSIVLYLKNTKYHKTGEGLPLAPIFIFIVYSRVENIYTNAFLFVVLVSVVYLQHENIKLIKRLRK